MTACCSAPGMTGLDLPGWAHLPGVTEGADKVPLDAAKALLPGRFEGPPAADHPAILYGIELCDRGYYWEAHEVLEAAWRATAQNGRDRQALRAIIQLANAGLKLRMGRPRAALRLLNEVCGRLTDALSSGGESGFAAALDAAGLNALVRVLAARLGRETTLQTEVPPIRPHLR